MKEYILKEEWRVIEEGFHPEYNRISESLFSLGNGRMGQRGNFEEPYGGDSLPGAYLGGIYYPERARRSKYKVGLPEQYMKLANAANWIGIHVEIDGEALDLAACELKAFRRVLDMKAGTLERRFHARLHSGKELMVRALRFCSMAEQEIGAVRYALTPLNFSGTLTLTPFIDLNVTNEEREEEERFWVEVETQVKRSHAYLVSETKKTEFQVCTGMKFDVFRKGRPVDFNAYRIHREKYVACSVDLPCREEEEITLHKYVANLSSIDHPREGLLERCKSIVKEAARKGFDALLEAHVSAWADLWARGDVVIEGDTAAQQGIRFNIFHLFQAFSGKDERLSVSPKGFTGERYGGCTYWSAEAYCLPFFLGTLGKEAARNLLMYRYRHLSKAIENAEKLGFVDGAALYPMVTMNGEECSTDWEIALGEIHRNGAIAYAIHDYVRHTADRDFLIHYGLEMLIAISRFWSQRVHYSERRRRYVLHAVTGPNEYESNVNNNWYTNYLASWCLRYTIQVWKWMGEEAPGQLRELIERIKFYEFTETNNWQKIIDQMYIPWDEQTGIFPQQDGFLDKQLTGLAMPEETRRPLNRHWSWDRIQRSPYIQRADVLQGLFFFADNFDEETLRRNFEFYEPMTVHESSLSPGLHAVLAARLGKLEKAYEYFIRSSRLDLEDFNGDTAAGCHVTSMGGTWLAVVRGFAGIRVVEDVLRLDPELPPSWEAYAFKLQFRNCSLKFRVHRAGVTIENGDGQPLRLAVFGQDHLLEGRASLNVGFA